MNSSANDSEMADAHDDVHSFSISTGQTTDDCRNRSAASEIGHSDSTGNTTAEFRNILVTDSEPNEDSFNGNDIG